MSTKMLKKVFRYGCRDLFVITNYETTICLNLNCFTGLSIYSQAIFGQELILNQGQGIVSLCIQFTF